MWDVRACRSCLAVKGKLEKIGEALKRQYTAITGIQISDDGYPTFFCVECRHHIKKSLAFRRKSRRAHFVLKEIMAVRKQISYSDIITVNRRKTNLESSLNYWEPKNSACYLIADRGAGGEREGCGDEELRKYHLASVPLDYTKTYSTHLVDIEPEVVEPTEPPPVETNESIEGADDNGFNEEDIPSNDYLDTEADTANIDMNDIFKDLNIPEQPDDIDDGIEELKPPASTKVRTKKNKEIDDLCRITIAVKNLVEILNLYDLRVLSVEEQIEGFNMRSREKSFVTAYYKCAVCLTVSNSMHELLQHVEFHNKRKFLFECKVCKNKVPTAEELNAHTANYHMYEYSCRKCDAKFYCQIDAIRHTRRTHLRNNSKKVGWRQIPKTSLAGALNTFTITTLTQEMMREVMKFGSRADCLQAVEPDQLDPESWQAKNYLKCDVCGLWLKQRDHLEKHMTLKHRFMYTCKICKEVFTTRQQALEHSVTHESLDKTLECIDCGVEFNDVVELRRHRRKEHLQKKCIPCNLCGHTARHDKLFYKHQLREHGYISLNDELTGDPRYKCEECSVQFMGRRSLEQHLVNMNHKGADTIELACIPCKKLFESAEELETHYITCVYSRKYPRNCCYCPEVLNSPVEYKCHYIQQHPTLPYRYVSGNCICDVCGKSVFKAQLEAHLKSHTSDAYTCRLCSFTAPSPARYVGHVINCHTPRPYLCALCPQRFKSRSNCKRHVLRVHAPTKLYKCDFCGKEFSYFHSLKKHSASLHNVMVPSVKSALPLNCRHKIYVYAHMRIEINELERPIIEKTNIELVDYLELQSKPVDYNNYFVFNPNVQETVCYTKSAKRFRRRKKIKQTELEAAIAHIKPEADNIEVNATSENYQRQTCEMKDEMEVDSEVVHEDKLEINKTESKENNKIESVVESTEPYEVEAVDETALPLEVIESDGHQYVMIGGEMYRIASEDDL